MAINYGHCEDLTSFQLIADEIGPEAATRIAKKLAGHEIKFTRKMNSKTGCFLVEKLGQADAELLMSSAFTSETVYFPKHLSRKQRTAAIRKYIAEQTSKGASAREIADVLKISERSVRSYRAKIRAEATRGPSIASLVKTNAPLTGHEPKKRSHLPENTNARPEPMWTD